MLSVIEKAFVNEAEVEQESYSMFRFSPCHASSDACVSSCDSDHTIAE
jgi:hypothetical protein